MLYREIIAVCSEIHTKHVNTLCGQHVGFYTRSQNCEKRLLASSCMSVRLSVCLSVCLSVRPIFVELGGVS